MPITYHDHLDGLGLVLQLPRLVVQQRGHIVELLRLVVQQRGHIVDFNPVGCNLYKEFRVRAICGRGGSTVQEPVPLGKMTINK